MQLQVPSCATVAVQSTVPIPPPFPLPTLIESPGAPVPLKVGVVCAVGEEGWLNPGGGGGVVSMVKTSLFELQVMLRVLVATATTVCTPSASALCAVQLQLVFPALAATVQRVVEPGPHGLAGVPPSQICSESPRSAVPEKVGRFWLVGVGVWAMVEPQAPPVTMVKESTAEAVPSAPVCLDHRRGRRVAAVGERDGAGEVAARDRRRAARSARRCRSARR